MCCCSTRKQAAGAQGLEVTGKAGSAEVHATCSNKYPHTYNTAAFLPSGNTSWSWSHLQKQTQALKAFTWCVLYCFYMVYI